MSNSSSKQRYNQLQEWLSTFKNTTKTNKRKSKRFSKADHYKAKGAK